MGNSVIFPAPKDKTVPVWMESRIKYFTKPRRDGEDSGYSFIPFFCCGDRKITRKIPYLHFTEETESKRSKYLLIYFHGNSELLSHSYRTLEKYHSIFQIDVLSPEYPGYGIYENEVPCEKTILEDATLIIQHSIQNLKYKEENIILIGRSLGTGVSIHMATIFPKLRGIVLVSPYLSIREVAERIVGKVLAKVVPDIFRSEDYIQVIKTPALFIHGVKDKLIPCTDSKRLYEKCNAPKMINLSPQMDHNRIDLKNDLFLPILKFFVEKLDMAEFGLMYACEDIGKLSMLGSMENHPLIKTQLQLQYDEMDFDEYSQISAQISTKNVFIEDDDHDVQVKN